MYTLYFAPDNASLIVRMVLEELGQDYDTHLVDRRSREQESTAYRTLNPNGLIPTCVMDDEPVFETAAIVLTLAERHGALAPPHDCPQRPKFLKWLFFVSNTLHPALRQLFNSDKYAGQDPICQTAHSRIARDEVISKFDILEDAYRGCDGPFLLGDRPCVVDIYTAVCMRWAQLYPIASPGTIRPDNFPGLKRMATELEARPTVAKACEMEGIEPPFLVRPSYPNGKMGAAF